MNLVDFPLPVLFALQKLGNFLSGKPNPGMVAEIYINEEQVAKNVRVQTARMPVVNHPAGIFYAQVY